MKVGVMLPQPEIGSDPAALRDFVQAAEDLGYSHLSVYEEVLGADPLHHQEFTESFNAKDMFHEPFVLFGFLASITSKLELVTAVVALGQRQTALVAKQAAEVDVLSGGRLRLGIGVGWNQVEYEALNENFHNRGRRCEEQIELLRSFWTQEVVDFRGRWHQVNHSGINPLPVQRPIPIWIGAGSQYNLVPNDRVLRRIARLSDGWFPQFPPDAAGRATLAKLAEFIKQAGRDPSSIGLEARIEVSVGDADFWQERVAAWWDLGATHISVNTMEAGLQSVGDHIAAIQRFKEVVSA